MVPVRLPKEVLSLFPTWEYCCPSCGTYVESNVSFCPSCKAPFDEKRWRVPPRFLKSHKAMSKYAHKVLAPKLSPEQRELLFKYFTEFFGDGFESGNFSAWTGTETFGSNTQNVVSDDSHHGIYSAKFTDPSGGVSSAYKTITASSNVYMRAYVRFSSPTTVDTDDTFALKFSNGLSTWLLIAGVEYVSASGKYSWILYNKNGATSIITRSTSTFALDTNAWYCMEAHLVIHGSNGEAELWIDGVSTCKVTGQDTDNYGNINTCKVGLDHRGGDTIYVDCVVIADTYIGPESTEQTYTKTWTTDALFKKLAIPKALSVDVAFQKQDVPKNFGLDAAFQKSFNIQKQIDILLKRFDIPKSFTLDARFGALVTHIISRQIDAVLKKLDSTKTFGLDVYFGPVESETYAKTFGLSVIFAYKVRLPELWLDENGRIVLNISKPYTWVGT